MLIYIVVAPLSHRRFSTRHDNVEDLYNPPGIQCLLFVKPVSLWEL